MTSFPRIVVNCRCVLGESPIWHALERKLYWTDIATGQLFRYDPFVQNYEQVLRGETIGGFTIQIDGKLLLCSNKGVTRLWHNGICLRATKPLKSLQNYRFNDAITDPKGRVFSGIVRLNGRTTRFHHIIRLLRHESSRHKLTGSIYRIDNNGELSRLIENVSFPNGMGFSPDCRKLYVTDSLRSEINVFDYDVETGTVGKSSRLVRIPKSEGKPDGLTVDAEGFIWSARWNGGCIVRYSPEGLEERRISFPVRKITSLTFGGEDYSDIYVTSAGGNKPAVEGLNAGALFHLNLGIQGIPEFLSTVEISDEK